MAASLAPAAARVSEAEVAVTPWYDNVTVPVVPVAPVKPTVDVVYRVEVAAVAVAGYALVSVPPPVTANVSRPPANDV